jgi:hypothetical protein
VRLPELLVLLILASAGDLACDLQFKTERNDLSRVASWKKRKPSCRGTLELLRQVLKSKIDESAATTGLRDSIRIHQVADPIDMTQQAAEREMAMQNLHRGAALTRQLRSAMRAIR